MTTLERELKRGVLEMLILRMLADEPSHGYKLLSRLSQRSRGRFELKEGTLYPVLYRLEDAGWVEPEWEQSGRGVPRKVYRLTVAGRDRLSELAEVWRSYSVTVESILEGETVEEES